MSLKNCAPIMFNNKIVKYCESKTKVCKLCQKRKPITQYYDRYTYCTECAKKLSKLRYQKLKIQKQIKKCEVVEIKAPEVKRDIHPLTIVFFGLSVLELLIILLLLFGNDLSTYLK